MFFVPKAGQHPDRTKETLETGPHKLRRIQAAASRKIRQISSWNVYLKHTLEGQTLSPEEYTRKVRSAGADWSRMESEEKHAFQIEACHQERLRSELAETPFTVGQKTAFVTELEKRVGRNSCKLFSARRLALNERNFDTHSAWSLPTCLGESSL